MTYRFSILCFNNVSLIYQVIVYLRLEFSNSRIIFFAVATHTSLIHLSVQCRPKKLSHLLLLIRNERCMIHLSLSRTEEQADLSI